MHRSQNTTTYHGVSWCISRLRKVGLRGRCSCDGRSMGRPIDRRLRYFIHFTALILLLVITQVGGRDIFYVLALMTGSRNKCKRSRWGAEVEAKNTFWYENITSFKRLQHCTRVTVTRAVQCM